MHDRKDKTMEFPIPVIPKRANILIRLYRYITSGFIYQGDKL